MDKQNQFICTPSTKAALHIERSYIITTQRCRIQSNSWDERPPCISSIWYSSCEFVAIGKHSPCRFCEAHCCIRAPARRSISKWRVPKGCRKGAKRVPKGCRKGAKRVPLTKTKQRMTLMGFFSLWNIILCLQIQDGRVLWRYF